jgi:hypothetical protein
VRPSAGFLLRFFALAAALFAFWSFGGLGDAYAHAVMRAAGPFMSATSGFRVSSTRPTARGLDVLIIRPGGGEVFMPLQPRELFSGLIPFLALVGATGRLGWRRRTFALAAGVAVLFVFHIGLMMLGPYMTGIPQAGLPRLWIGRVNKLIDVFYGFYGLVGFAALPFLLWWWLANWPRGASPPPPSDRTPVRSVR